MNKKRCILLSFASQNTVFKTWVHYQYFPRAFLLKMKNTSQVILNRSPLSFSHLQRWLAFQTWSRLLLVNLDTRNQSIELVRPALSEVCMKPSSAGAGIDNFVISISRAARVSFFIVPLILLYCALHKLSILRNVAIWIVLKVRLILTFFDRPFAAYHWSTSFPAFRRRRWLGNEVSRGISIFSLWKSKMAKILVAFSDWTIFYLSRFAYYSSIATHMFPLYNYAAHRSKQFLSLQNPVNSSCRW